VVFHRSLGERIARVAPRLPKLKLLIEVDDIDDDEGGPDPVPNAFAYEDVLARHKPAARVEPQGDEVYMLYTGGTTGMPKGVVYPLDEFTQFFVAGYPPMIGMPPIENTTELLANIRAQADSAGGLVAMSGPPLMHGTGCWLGLMAPHMLGGATVLLENRGLDPVELWDAVARERVQQLIIVGDAFARPLLRELEQAPQRWDLSCLKLMISSGAMFSTEVKQALFEHLPDLTIADLLGSTEGGMGQAISRRDSPNSTTARFMLSPTTKVFNEQGREVTPGSGETGLVASGGLVPKAYYKDPEKSARTFRVVDGVRYSFPGDMARVTAEGELELLGRGSNCINTGGEKVFPEEVEETLKRHPAVEDALVFGQPDERFGNRVVGVVSIAPGQSATATDIITATQAVLAGYKVPRELMLLAEVPRAPNGKADYPAAKASFEAAQGD